MRSRFVRVGLGVIAAVALLASTRPGFGHAASLAAASKTLGAKGTVVSPCDTDGFTIVPNLTLINVTSVTVGAINAACAAGTLSVTVNNTLTNSTGSAAVPAVGGSVTVTLALPVTARDVEQIDVSITGP